MVLILTFGVVLLITVALSGLAARSVLSTALVFLLAGALVGPGFLGLIEVSPDSPAVSILADLALFTVLFVDGARLPVRELRTGWRLSGRALAFGMPLALVLVALAAHFLVGLDWTTALLVGAILSPTDPVFASAIVSRTEVPERLRRLLNIESGVNDGLALPFVLVFLALAGGAEADPGQIAVELVLGIVFGVTLPLVVGLLLRLPVLGAEPKLQPLEPLAVAVVLYALCHMTHANPYLAAFAAGITVATVTPDAAHAFEGFGELASELTKFAAVLVFGALLTPIFLVDLTLGEWAVALLSLLLIRPASVLVSLLGARLSRRERYAAAWFGPKGFASVVYGLLVVQSGIAAAGTVFELVALTIAVSMIAHSMSDVPVAKAFDVQEIAGLPADQPDRPDHPDPPTQPTSDHSRSEPSTAADRPDPTTSGPDPR
jgi:NhaP-type Na+/H+ or K+/H+ antiporter